MNECKYFFSGFDSFKLLFNASLSVGEEFDVDSFAQEILRDDGSARFLGDTTLSWGWDLSSRKLFHAGHPIATYPIFEGQWVD